MSDVSPAAEALLVAFDEVQLAEMHAAASARIKRVRALHQRQYDECTWCSTNDRHVAWPCPTVQALNGPGPTESVLTQQDIDGRIAFTDAVCDAIDRAKKEEGRP